MLTGWGGGFLGRGAPILKQWFSAQSGLAPTGHFSTGIFGCGALERVGRVNATGI